MADTQVEAPKTQRTGPRKRRATGRAQASKPAPEPATAAATPSTPANSPIRGRVRPKAGGNAVSRKDSPAVRKANTPLAGSDSGSATPSTRKRERPVAAAEIAFTQESLRPSTPTPAVSSEAVMSTQRNRAARSGPRSNGAETGEEQQIWASAKDIIKGVMVKVTELERIREKIVSRETDIKDKGLTNQDKRDLEDLYRQSVKTAEEVADTLKNDDTGLLQQLDILKVLMAHNDVPAAELPRRGATAIAREARERSAIADLDGSIDSPAPSPVVEKPSRKDRTASSRSSLPPKEVPIKKEDTEPPRSAVAEPAGATAKQGKITFAMDEEVAFKPKASGAEEHEWIQGRVVRIIGEGKSRRYDVLDPEPEDTKKHGSIYRTSASSMVAIPPEGAALPDYPKGKHVLARYPQTTAFYRAEVVGMATDKVLLKFEGEETASMVKEVDRRFVLDHRG